MIVRIFFVDDRTRYAYEGLLRSKTEDRRLHDWISHAIECIRTDPFSGIPIRKGLVPRKYRGLPNLWKYNLPNGWRLLYSIQKEEVAVIAIILDWLTHKKYERLFGY